MENRHGAEKLDRMVSILHDSEECENEHDGSISDEDEECDIIIDNDDDADKDLRVALVLAKNLGETTGKMM